MATVYGMAPSGNCWKVAQILRLTGTPFRWVEADTNGGETRTPEFRRRNPFGKVPVLELDDGTVLVESNAILAHVAEGTPWLPAPGLARTRVMEWLFFEQYSHEPHIAVVRFWVGFAADPPPAHVIEEKRAGGYAALDAMERHLDERDFLVADRFTIADIALYAYTHVAGEGGFAMGGYPAIGAWLGRVAAIPGHVPIDA
jgi:glutathione S-transferase